MIYLADRGDADREDNGCGILYGVLRDSAYKLKNLAEDEKANHIQKGWWPKKEWILKNPPEADTCQMKNNGIASLYLSY